MDNNTFSNWCIDVKTVMSKLGMFTSMDVIEGSAEWREDYEAGITPEDAVERVLSIF